MGITYRGVSQSGSKEVDLTIWNNKLKHNGSETFSQFIHSWIKHEYLTRDNNKQVEKLIQRTRTKVLLIH